MDTNYLTELVMDKFIKHEHYTEVPINDLTKTIGEYLDKYYLDQVKMGIAKLQIRQAKGEAINEINYKESYELAKEKTIKQAYAVGAVDKGDLKDLKAMARL